ncbi:MAG TPA: hypothetical protein DCZ20_08260 [Lachnospiraceae bacterium]|nr:hypothetical protein [Lachnospiraceae bacterium]
MNGQERKTVMKSEKRTEKKAIWNRKKAAAVVAAIGLTAAGSAIWMSQMPSFAYLTDHGSLVNRFTQGKLEIIPQEPKWPGDQEAAAPGDVVAKNPMVQAADGCEVPAYVYLQVKVPYGMATQVNDDGTLYDKDINGVRVERLHQLLTFGVGEPKKSTVDGTEHFLVGEHYQVDADSAALDTEGHGLTAHIGNGAKEWTLLRTEITGPAKGDAKQIKGYVVYTYSYNSMLADTDHATVKKKYAEAMAKGRIVKATISLFEQVRMLNCIEGQLEDVTMQMPVKAFAIQAPHTGNDSDMDSNALPETTDAVIRYAKTAFEKYAGQNADNGTAAVDAGNFMVKE